jgi:alpha/beta superfamily hydrolase
MSEESINFRSGDLTLEGVLHLPDGPVAGGGVICHPHPLYGGSMYNNVVDAVVAAMIQRNWAALRFNFRGVGGSEGEHSGGAGEADDAAAAVAWLADQAKLSHERIVLAGYSFGAMATAIAAAKLADLAALMLVALPLRMADLDSLMEFKRPILLAAGDADSYCPAADLKVLAQKIGARAEVRIIERADHFFGGREAQLTAAVSELLGMI